MARARGVIGGSRITKVSVVLAAVLSWLVARDALADCNVQDGIRYCSWADPSFHGVVAAVGRDGDGQWIGWMDATTYECLGWDLIGGTGAFSNDTVVEGTNQNDVIFIVGGTGYDFCGYPIDYPVAGFHTMTLSSWGGGYDYLLSYTTDFSVSLECAQGDGCYFELWSGGDVVGSSGIDYLVKNGNRGSFGWRFFMGEGNDTVKNYTQDTPNQGDCGAGYDDYDGPVGGLTGCEI